MRVVDPASPWLTTEEGARYGKCGPKTLYHEVAAGRLRAAKVGGKGRLLFRREWIDEWHLRNATPIEVTR